MASDDWTSGRVGTLDVAPVRPIGRSAHRVWGFSVLLSGLAVSFLFRQVLPSFSAGPKLARVAKHCFFRDGVGQGQEGRVQRGFGRGTDAGGLAGSGAEAINIVAGAKAIDIVAGTEAIDINAIEAAFRTLHQSAGPAPART